jgi:hypothetical protein
MPFRIQAALNTNIDIFQFSVPVSLSVMLVPTAPCSQADFHNLMNRPNQVSAKDSHPTTLTEEQLKQKLTNNNIAFVFNIPNEKAGFSTF